MKSGASFAAQLISKLKVAELQRLATLTGAPMTGTKAELADSLANITKAAWRPSSSVGSRQSAEFKVMSIDMGIRNLAFAFYKSSLIQTDKGAIELCPPQISQWQRIDLTANGLDALKVPGAESESILSTDGTNGASIETSQSFEPSEMAEQAYKFVKYCLDQHPTHVLIERQRFRSGGHSAVQEWTLRVGMFEAMLHATFRALRFQGCDQVSVESVLPMRVNKYWFKDLDVPATGKLAKQAKIDLVRGMLERQGQKDAEFAVGANLAETVKDFAVKESKRSKTVKQAGKPKLDDMSDSLLQGLAWIQWQHNRSVLLHRGLDAFDLD